MAIYTEKRTMKQKLTLAIFLLTGYLLTTGCQPAEESFTIVVLPDTQTYLEQCPEVFDSQIDWLLEHRDSIDAVLQVGDLTQDNRPIEWAYMQKAFTHLDKARIPYAVVWGNHDIGSRPGKYSDVHDTSLANKYFPLADKARQPYWGGSADGKSLDNYFITLQGAGKKWLILNLEFGPTDEALVWADSLLASHDDCYVVLNTHAYLYCDSTLQDSTDWWRPQDYGIGKIEGRPVNDGAGIWKKLVEKHRNIIAVCCGHVLKSGVGTLVSTGNNGNKVYQMLANFQRGVDGSQLGGEGYLRILTFVPAAGEIRVKTYSTWNKTYHPSPAHCFTFKEVNFDDYISSGGKSIS